MARPCACIGHHRQWYITEIDIFRCGCTAGGRLGNQMTLLIIEEMRAGNPWYGRDLFDPVSSSRSIVVGSIEYAVAGDGGQPVGITVTIGEHGTIKPRVAGQHFCQRIRHKPSY